MNCEDRVTEWLPGFLFRPQTRCRTLHAVTRGKRFIACFALSVGLQLFSFGANPQISAFSPLVVIPGKKTVLTFSGSNLGTVSNLWTSFQASTRRVTNSNPDLLYFEVICPRSVAPGVYAVQLGGSEGISNYELLLVDWAKPEVVAEGSTNRGTTLHPPCAIDSTSKPETVDDYFFAANAGESFSIELIAQRIGSQMDPVVQVFDSAGREAAYCDDEPGIWRDSRFRFTAALQDSYRIAVHDVGFAGGAAYKYRLRVTHDPLIWYSFPLVDPAEGALPFENAGAIAPVESSQVSPANPPLPAAFPTAAALAEREPNDTLEQAQLIPINIVVNGKVQRSNDIDLFTFEARQDQKLVFQSSTRSLGSPCDLVLLLRKGDGTVIAQSDSTLPTEAALTNAFAETGRYFLEVRELTGMAEPGVPYRIKIHEFSPGVAVSIATNRLVIKPGSSATAKINVTRFGYAGPVHITSAAPVEGLSFENEVIAANKAETELKIKAASTLTPGAMLHFRLAATLETNCAPFEVSTRAALRKAFPLLPIIAFELDGLIAVGIAGE